MVEADAVLPFESAETAVTTNDPECSKLCFTGNHEVTEGVPSPKVQVIETMVAPGVVGRVTPLIETLSADTWGWNSRMLGGVSRCGGPFTANS